MRERAGKSRQKLRRRHTERLRERRYNGDSRIAHAAFNARNIGAVKARAIGEFFLRPPLLGAQTPQIAGELAANVHRQQRPAL